MIICFDNELNLWVNKSVRTYILIQVVSWVIMQGNEEKFLRAMRKLEVPFR